MAGPTRAVPRFGDEVGSAAAATAGEDLLPLTLLQLLPLLLPSLLQVLAVESVLGSEVALATSADTATHVTVDAFQTSKRCLAVTERSTLQGKPSSIPLRISRHASGIGPFDSVRGAIGTVANMMVSRSDARITVRVAKVSRRHIIVPTRYTAFHG